MALAHEPGLDGACQTRKGKAAILNEMAKAAGKARAGEVKALALRGDEIGWAR
jgi:hypothetical protein